MQLQWKTTWRFLKKLNRIITWSSNSPSRYLSKRLEVRNLKRYLHSHVNCNTIYNSQFMKTTQMSLDGWMNKENVIYIPTHIIEYFSAFKNKGILLFVTAWINLEGIMLSEINQYKKTNTACFHLYEIHRMVILIETESRMVVASASGYGKYGVVFQLV